MTHWCSNCWWWTTKTRCHLNPRYLAFWAVSHLRGARKLSWSAKTPLHLISIYWWGSFCSRVMMDRHKVFWRSTSSMCQRWSKTYLSNSSSTSGHPCSEAKSVHSTITAPTQRVCRSRTSTISLPQHRHIMLYCMGSKHLYHSAAVNLSASNSQS